MDSPTDQFCVSWLTLCVANAGASQAVQAWNKHPIPGMLLLTLAIEHLCITQWSIVNICTDWYIYMTWNYIQMYLPRSEAHTYVNVLPRSYIYGLTYSSYILWWVHHRWSFCLITLPKTMPPIATWAGGVFPSTHWRRYRTCARATCTVWFHICISSMLSAVFSLYSTLGKSQMSKCIKTTEQYASHLASYQVLRKQLPAPNTVVVN